MYLLDLVSNCIVEFTLSTSYDITTAVANGNTFDTTPDIPLDIMFRSNGMEFFILNNLGDFMRYHLDDAWDISTVSFFPNSFNVVDSNGVMWKPDGTKFFSLVLGGADRIDQHTVPNRWNVADASLPTSFGLSGISANPRGMWWNREGTRCFVIDSGTNIIVQLNIAIGYAIVTMTDSGNMLDLTAFGAGITGSEGLVFTEDGLTLYVLDSGSETVYQFTLTTPLDIVTGVSYTGNSFLIPSGNNTDIRLSTDERFFYISDRGDELVKRFSLPADKNISNAVFLDDLDISAIEGNIRGIYIRETDGKKLYIVGQTAGAIVSLDMTLEFNDALVTILGEDLSTELGETLVYA